jgi:hypothetical protein
MLRSLKPLVALFVLTATLPLPVIGQTHYKCKTGSGSTIFSDAPCPTGTRQEQAVSVTNQARQYAEPDPYSAPPRNSDARMLDAKVAEALGTGNLPRAKSLALTTEHWKMISDHEQQQGRPITGRTDADLRAESRNSKECKDAQWSYDVEASSIRKDAAQIGAAKRRMHSACGMNEPNVVDNRTLIDNRQVASPVAPRPMTCQQKMNGQMFCW